MPRKKPAPQTPPWRANKTVVLTAPLETRGKHAVSYVGTITDRKCAYPVVCEIDGILCTFTKTGRYLAYAGEDHFDSFDIRNVPEAA